MYKIDSIKLTNFKFFFGDGNLPLERKHTLIYGENGSGKSSVYWALHCFLHSTLKPNADSVKKYFKHITEHDESIRNRYAGKEKKSGVFVKLSHDDKSMYADINAEVSNTTVNTQTNSTIKLMTLSSELINYKVIYSMYTATNKDSIELFDYFVRNLMEFINFDHELTLTTGAKISKNALECWRYIEANKPNPIIGTPKYTSYQAFIELFNTKFGDYLQLITQEANRVLTEDFNEDFRIILKYKEVTFNELNKESAGKRKTRNKSLSIPKVWLIVELPNLAGKSSIVQRPQSYLNEARLSSIAIAIRLAILQERFIDKAPKIMILDDLLLSLDLGNRSAVLNLLLNKYSHNYQIIILTHDRVFFDCVLKYLPKDKDERREHWRIFEMYETEDGTRKVPVISLYEDPLSKAYAYFKGSNCPIDYNACGNNQRQALEEIFKEQFKRYGLRDTKGSLIETKSLLIGQCIALARPMYNDILFDTSRHCPVNCVNDNAKNKKHY